MPEQPTRVILVDDQALVRDALARRLDAASDIVVVGEAPDADEAVELALERAPDVVIFDIDMPGRSAFDAARALLDRRPNVRVLFLSAYMTDHYIERALDAGASGYLTKGEPARSLLAALRALMDGRTYFSPEIQSRLVIDVDGPKLHPERATRLSILTPREREVVAYIARGMTKRQIAETMHLSIKTIENHSNNLMSKLDIHDRVGLARFAIREGLSQP
ncbi:MAG: response regulator transcription factor [Planctomycetota bacterium]